MSNLPVVYSTGDRHALLMDLARKVTKQVNDNPHPADYHEDTEPIPTVQSVHGSSK